MKYFKNINTTELLQSLSVFFLFLGFFYANVVFDFSRALPFIGSNSALTYEYQQQLLQEHVDRKQAEVDALNVKNPTTNIAPTKRLYIERVSDSIIILFSYIFGFLHEGSEGFALGKWRNHEYAANAYNATELMSINAYTYIDNIFNR